MFVLVHKFLKHMQFFITHISTFLMNFLEISCRHRFHPLFCTRRDVISHFPWTFRSAQYDSALVVTHEQSLPRQHLKLAESNRMTFITVYFSSVWHLLLKGVLQAYLKSFWFVEGAGDSVTLLGLKYNFSGQGPTFEFLRVSLYSLGTLPPFTEL